MKLKDVLTLGEESVVVLDRLTDELLDVMVNGKAIAKGEIVAQGNRFGLRIDQALAGTSSPSMPALGDGGALISWYILKLLILLPLIGFVAWGCLKLARKLQDRATATNGPKSVRVIETTMLSPTLKLAVIEFHEREIWSRPRAAA